MIALTSLELATGIVLGGAVERPPPLPDCPSGVTPFAALESVCLRALDPGPCFVSFSGGKDSSLVLAAAARTARRHGLPLPVPVTNRFPNIDHTYESDWQELVVAHLGLRDWVRLDLTDELDVLGPIATRALRRHGLLWPFNAHFHGPLLEAAEGGSLLTGIGGDEVFGSSRWARGMAVLHGAERLQPRDLPRLALLAAPRPLRRAALARRAPDPLRWLRPAASRALTRAWAADQAMQPSRIGPRLHVLPHRRAFRLGLASLEQLAAGVGASVAHPLLDPSFLAAVAAAGHRPWTERTSAMTQLFGDVLPARLLSRSSKARFEGAFWGPHSRAFAASWRGEAADPAVVDARALRHEWSRAEPDAHSYLLLQAAWLRRASTARLDDRLVPNAALHT